jgi:hypothetical protein
MSPLVNKLDATNPKRSRGATGEFLPGGRREFWHVMGCLFMRAFADEKVQFVGEELLALLAAMQRLSQPRVSGVPGEVPQPQARDPAARQ